MKPEHLTGKISIVVPVYNEEDNVLPLAAELRDAAQQASRSYELIFVDDASTDATWSRIAEAHRRDPFVRGLRHTRNAGQSAALWTGLEAARGEVLVTLDGDCQNNPADLPSLLEQLGDCDFVCGVRQKRQDNWLRLVSTRVARWARRSVFNVDFRDTGCAFRAFRRSAIDGLLPFNGIHRFLPVLVHANGARVKEVPISHRPRLCGVSKYGLWNRLGRGMFDLVGVKWYLKRRVGRQPTTLLSPDRENVRPAFAAPALRDTSPALQPVEAA
jgi:dolichol-phosphate mannosyltransferase